MVTVTLSDLVDSVNVTLSILPDTIFESDEQFSAVLSLLEPFEFSDKIIIDPAIAFVNILDSNAIGETSLVA